MASEDALTILRPEKSDSGFERVFAFLREQLISGVLVPGDRLLSERELAAQLGVSRPSLREALRALAMFGIVQTHQGAGTVVQRPDISVLEDFFALALSQHPSMIDDVMQARVAIECQAARLACARATPSDLEQLRAALEAIAATIEDPLAGSVADHRFHAALVQAGHSDTLSTLYGAIKGLLLRSHADRRISINRAADRRTYLIDHHRQIFDELAGGDADRIDAVLRQHFAIGDEYRRQRAISGAAVSSTRRARVTTRGRAA
jgi:GntR family transcriptional regulator, transcriptional repressor for pyruvate dehydrogenase complex